jgi:hypothetical protein
MQPKHSAGDEVFDPATRLRLVPAYCLGECVPILIGVDA